MDDLKRILQKLLKTAPHYQENMLKLRIYEAWPRIVGERVAKHCWPVRMVDDGALLIAAESSVWLHSLRFLEAQILEKYEKELQGRKVTALRFKLETKDMRME